MEQITKTSHITRWSKLCLCIATLMAGCAAPPPPPPAPVPAPVKPVAPPQPAIVEPEFKGPVSAANTPREYRRDAAAHIYSQNGDRVFKGKMPPLLYAVGVLQVEVDRKGNVVDVRWMRSPSQAPEVMAEIVRTVKAASPFPAPAKLGGTVYTDTWLWHKSGRFQLDTLTEGQL
jgi:hypothetical protein